MRTAVRTFEGRLGKQDFASLPAEDVYRCPAGEHLKWWDDRLEYGQVLRHYWTTRRQSCTVGADCTTGKQRGIKRWEHEAVLDAMQQRLDHAPQAMATQRQTVEHVFGTIKAWMVATHFLTRTLNRVRTEMSLQVLAYDMKRLIAILGTSGPIGDSPQSWDEEVAPGVSVGRRAARHPRP
jgi:transposase